MPLPKVPKFHVRNHKDIEMGDPTELVLIHLAVDEAQALDALQGGPDIQNGIRSYAKLGPIFEDPEVKATFRRVHEELDNKNPEAEAMYQVGTKALQPFQQAPADMDPKVENVENLGVGGDSLLVWMPENMLILFSSISGGLRENPNTGLFALGGSSSNPIARIGKGFESVGRGIRDTFKNPGNFARTAVAIVGSTLIGGPIGGIGGTIGHLRAQGNGEKGFGGAFKGMSIAKLGEFGLNSMGYQLPSMAGVPGLGNIANGMNSLGQMGANMGSSMGLPQTSSQHGLMGSIAQGGKNMANSWMNPSAGGAAGAAGTGGGGIAGAAGAGKTAASSGGVGSFLSNPMMLLAAQHALSAIGDKQNEKKEREQYERDKAEREDLYRRSGMFDRWTPPEAEHRRMTPYSAPTTEELQGGFRRGNIFERYASGGPVDDGVRKSAKRFVSQLIKGPGKGQDDKIRTDVPENTYIIDASSTSMFGDGSSDAGAAALKKAILQAKRTIPQKRTMTKARGAVPVYLSNDEFAVSPEDVAAFGGGSEDKGAYLLKGMVKALRKHKSSNGDRLPPRAKDPLKYIKLSRRD